MVGKIKNVGVFDPSQQKQSRFTSENSRKIIDGDLSSGSEVALWGYCNIISLADWRSVKNNRIDLLPIDQLINHSGCATQCCSATAIRPDSFKVVAENNPAITKHYITVGAIRSNDSALRVQRISSNIRAFLRGVGGDFGSGDGLFRIADLQVSNSYQPTGSEKQKESPDSEKFGVKREVPSEGDKRPITRGFLFLSSILAIELILGFFALNYFYNDRKLIGSALILIGVLMAIGAGCLL